MVCPVQVNGFIFQQDTESQPENGWMYRGQMVAG